MGGGVFALNKGMEIYFPVYLHNKLTLLIGLAFLGISALAIFGIMAKILHIIDFKDILNSLRRKNGKTQ
jgi:hypothetical protein